MTRVSSEASISCSNHEVAELGTLFLCQCPPPASADNPHQASSGSVDALSAQCAFECFQGGTDVGFLREAARLLRTGGRLAIVPLYVEDVHFIATSPYTVIDRECVDEGSAVVWRDDEYDEPFSRHYSPDALVGRLGETLGLFSEARVVHMTNLEALRELWPDTPLYAYFVLECRK